MLTPKQEKFCQCIVSGMDGVTSYLTAYNCSSKHTANVESTKLMKRNDITARIKELNIPIQNTIQNNAISERKQQIDFIKSRIQECIKKDDEQSLIRWNEQLNKIYNLYKETEQEEKHETVITKLDANALKRLTSA